jgi:AcrR family transcriptional regulator
MNESTRQRIIKEAMVCISRNTNAGLDEIAEAAGVGRATLYRNFKSRDGLLTELKLSAGRQLMDAVGPVFESKGRARDKLVRCVTLMVPLGASLNVSAYFCKPFREDDEDPRVIAKYENHLAQVRQLCLDLREEGAIAGQTPVVWLVTVLTSLVFAAWENVESGDIAPKQAPWLVLETFLGGHGTAETLTWLNQLKEANL